jgi:glucokinase
MEWIAGDIGGTKSWLAWAADSGDGATVWRYERVYASGEFGSMVALLHAFMADANMRARPDGLILAVPGPVQAQRVRLTNLDWDIDAAAIRALMGIPQVYLVNDFEAAAAGVACLGDDERLALNAAGAAPDGVQVVTGAGTGLGLAFLLHDGDGPTRTYATEGGHSDFAPADARQDRLLARMRARYGHVSWERVASGSALPELHAFCCDELERPLGEPRDAAWIDSAAAAGDAAAEATLDLFTQLYGAWVGNVALLYRPRGGLYIAGGVSAHLQARILSDRFMASACDKGRMRGVVESTPMFLVISGRLGLQGAFAMRRSGHAERAVQ